MEYLIGIDIGTSGTKTVLFDTPGNALFSHTVEYPLYQPKNGWAEQDPNDWWNATVLGIRAVISKVNIDSIRGIGLSGQMHGLVMLDENDDVLRQSIIWCDQRTQNECIEITDKVGEKRIIEITANPALTGFTASKILWVRNNEREIYDKCKKILLPKDYIRFKLTGEYATEVSDASGMQLLDVPNRRWSDEVLDKLEIDKNLLGKVYESCEVTGEINEEASKLTGLKKGTIVVGGAGDNAAAAIGCGVCKPSKAFVTIGSSGVVYAHTDDVIIDPKGRVHTFCSSVKGKWHVMGVTQAAGLSLKWFRDNFCCSEIEIAKLLDEDCYSFMTREAEKSPIGSNKLVYLPYLMGERTPHLDPFCRGVFFGLSSIHKKNDMIRSIMEGVSFSQRDSLTILSEMGISINDMVACGGGSKSEFWREMLSDILRCNVKTVISEEGPALGVALLASVGAGIYKTIEEACEVCIKFNPSIEPNLQNAEKYDAFYEIYKELYPSLKKTFSDLQKL
ncbi:MAG: xylulokinase [Oscillospiraceae bacterium]|nr:xylulokinase [Oscillospiraceae bacterium]